MSENQSSKFCPKCKRDLPITEFYRINKSGRKPQRDRKTGEYRDRRTHTSWCKHCRKEVRDKVYARQRETGESAAISKRLYPKVWERRLRVDYGLTIEQYERMVAEQNNKCAICGCEEFQKHGLTGTIRRLSVDHDHKTFKVRQLLCHNCNCGLGRFKDDVVRLRKAVEYLERHQ